MPNYSIMITELEADLSRAMDEREKLQARIDALLTAIESVRSLAEDSDEEIIQPPSAPEAGFTEKVRTILDLNMSKSFTPVEIRDVLAREEGNSDPKIMLIHVHNTVKRLRRQGEIEEVVRPDGNKGYRAKSLMAKDVMGLRPDDPARKLGDRTRFPKRATPAISTEELIKLARKRDGQK
jgi:hypothetical protein